MEGAESKVDGNPTPLPTRRLQKWWGRLRRLQRVWAAREFERNYLLTLNDGQLWSMRLTREDARQLARKPFWRE
jgi:uncharacterized protein YjiS (DUF1127 family)